MTVEWRRTVEAGFGAFPSADHLGPATVCRLDGAVGRVVARGTGPPFLDLTEPRGRSAEARPAVTETARRLGGTGRSPNRPPSPPTARSSRPDLAVHRDPAT
ncbi:anti-sigma factor antagonist [Streptomyces scabiei]|uniref:anti-sigma factor antagonist n=1 Tax=Streptomyces scabiei TaxID=1930 RepID=UPI0038F5D98D